MAALLVFGANMRAQFYLSGTDPASVKWNSISSDSFEIIYPRQYPALSRLYLSELEKYKRAVSLSTGMVASQYGRSPIPVLLHCYNSASNGKVVWAPSRMEFYTLPQFNDASPMPWHTMLAIHEGRHASQMQNGYRKVFRPFVYILGEIIPSVASAYPGSLLLEGDAVVAETALTRSGRGRSASFLNEYYYNFDNGWKRNWMRWRLGSYYRSTPNHYAWGYLILSAIRVKYDKPLFIADYFDYVARRPYDPWPLRHALRRVSGMKFRDSYPGLPALHYELWASDTLSRGEWMPSKPLSPEARRLTTYSSPAASSPNASLWIKKDIYHLPSLVQLGGSSVSRRICQLSPTAANLNYMPADSSVVWTEYRSNGRWSQKVRSVLCSYKFGDGKKKTVLRSGAVAWACEVDSTLWAAVRNNCDGTGSIEIFDKNTSETKTVIAAPEGLQPLCVAFTCGKMYVSAIDENGCGIWQIIDGEWINQLPAIPVTITALRALSNGRLLFESDHNGSGEYYSFDPATLRVEMLSNSKYGSTAAVLRPGGGMDWASYSPKGTAVMHTDEKDLPRRNVKWLEYHHYPVADSLSVQEAALGYTGPDSCAFSADSARMHRYRKGSHAFRLHSWAPLYVEIDNISNLSFDNLQHIASLGLMGFFQNTASTVNGYAGYKASPDNNGRWWHSGHLKLTYSGLYPVFEAKIDIGEGRRTEYRQVCRINKFCQNGKLQSRKEVVVMDFPTSVPRITADVKAYVPLSWNCGNMYYGIIPSLSLIYNNDIYWEDFTNPGHFQLPLKPSAGIRGYAVQPTPSACIYPRWGIGAQINWCNPILFTYIYGYVPGICCGQGLRLTALHQWHSPLKPAFIGAYANILPRGFALSSAMVNLVGYGGTLFTADYAVPFYMGDWHISDVFYCTRGIVTPHFDCTTFGAGRNLWSAGASFEMEFGSFLWIRTPVTVGVTYSYNGGSIYSNAAAAAKMSTAHYAGFLFNITIPN